MAAQAQFASEIRRLAEEDPGRALDDYLVKSGMAKTPARWNTIKTSLRRSLAEGGSLNDLVKDGKICATPQEKLRATPYSWAAQAKERSAEYERDLQTQGSRNMLTVAERVNGGVSQETRRYLGELADLTKRSVTERKWEAASELIDAIVEREAIAIVEIKHKEELAKKDRQMYDDLRRAYDDLSDIAHVLAATVGRQDGELTDGGEREQVPVRRNPAK
ncbi:hypothetical protein [Azospirillum soli]|uniref:hypothetical protein n=1 Tax=Azospirillum soli TaxID=1304799 RepID=UPI001AE967ED|nr:hypothetical protein [Azospirillum soli]MBP2316051.1 hypothetical protein [Azospirillum soli]